MIPSRRARYDGMVAGRWQPDSAISRVTVSVAGTDHTVPHGTDLTLPPFQALRARLSSFVPLGQRYGKLAG
jgi:phenolic acid decarboxylase